MPSFKFAAAFVALCGLSAATPIEKRGKTFTLEQVHRGNFTKNGPSQVVKTFNKFGKAAPVEAVAAAAAASTGTVTTTPGDEYDSLYLTPVTVGSNTLELDFDTGSADLWVFSTALSSSLQSGHAVYNPSTSGTRKSGYTWLVTPTLVSPLLSPRSLSNVFFQFSLCIFNGSLPVMSSIMLQNPLCF